MDKDSKNLPTREKILDCAANLFASKGYTETSIRELASAVGMKESSIYNHFPSKIAILENILEEYSEITTTLYDQDMICGLKENPTPDGIMACMKIQFPENKTEFYLKRIYVILQEQHRNPIVRKFVCEQLILGTEQVFRTVIEALKELGILHPDTNADFWVRIHSSILYTFSNRSMLGIGDNSLGYTGMGLAELLYTQYDMMLKTCRI